MKKILILLLFIASSGFAQELVDKRTENSETFLNPDGTFTSKVYTAPKHYKDANGKFQKIDLSVKDEISTEFTKVVKAGNYTYRYHTNKSVGYKFEANGGSVMYAPTGDWTGETSVIEPTNIGIKETITLSVLSDGILSWKVVPPPLVKLENDGRVTFTDNKGNVLFTTATPWAEDAGRKRLPITVTYEGNVLTYVVNLTGAVFPITVDPTTNVSTTSGGDVQDYNSTTWATVRQGSATLTTNSTTFQIRVGKDASGNYDISRGFLNFPINIATTFTVTAATFYFEGNTNSSTVDFNIYLCKGLQTKGVVSTTWFNLFTGYTAGSDHTPTYWSGAWNTSTYSADWNTLALNAAGKTAIQSAQGDTLRMCILNYDWDIDNVAYPTSSEYSGVIFNVTGSGLEPYLAITYALPSGQYTHFRNKDGVPMMLNKSGVPAKLWGR